MDVIEREVKIDASPETVFAFFTDPERMTQWKGIRAELEPIPGGVYRVDVHGGDVIRGEYVEVVPHERIVFTWGWEGDGTPVPPGSSTVEIAFEADGPGTLLRLRHSGLPGADEIARHDAGWEHYLGRLAAAAGGDDPGPDPWAAEVSE